MRIADIRVDTELSLLLPPPGAREIEALATDIEARGVVVELVVTEDGLLLDGHRRLAAAKLAGLSNVPAKRVPVQGATWAKAFALALNLYRRHLGEAQRANLGSSLLRLERARAKGRQKNGQRRGGEIAGRGRAKQFPGGGKTEAVRATELVAAAVGVSRQTFERVEKVKREDPPLAKRLLNGELSVGAAYKKLRHAEIRIRSEKDVGVGGLVTELASVARRYRTVYVDPPWRYDDSGGRGAAENHYPTLAVDELAALSVGELAHTEGCHLWLWTTWPMIREGAPHDLVRSWGFRWVGEIVWDKEALGCGRWFRSRTEILILAEKKELPILSDCVDPLVRARREAHSRKPERFRSLISELSPGPRIELFSRAPRDNWDRWGLEA